MAGAAAQLEGVTDGGGKWLERDGNGGPCRVLLADDNRMMRRRLKVMLCRQFNLAGRRNVVWDEAETGEEVLDLLVDTR